MQDRLVLIIPSLHKYGSKSVIASVQLLRFIRSLLIPAEEAVYFAEKERCQF